MAPLHVQVGWKCSVIVMFQLAGRTFSVLCSLHPEGKSKTRDARQSIISPDWNFEKMGIGGLDKEFSDIFRRAFASRVFPPDIVEQMGKCPSSPPPFTFFCQFFLLLFVCSCSCVPCAENKIIFLCH